MSVAGARTSRVEISRAVERGLVIRGVIIAALLAFVFFAIPTLVGADWLTTFASVSIYAIVACGFGILYGRVGMISGLFLWCVRSWWPEEMPMSAKGRLLPSRAMSSVATRVESVWKASSSMSNISATCSA